MDADGWRSLLASNNFGTANSDLRKAFANVVKKLCTDLIKTQTIEALLSCRLTPLDKNPGLRLIRVGEVLRRIAGKVIVSVLKNDVIDCTGSLQVCAGQEAGIEAPVHSLNSMYNDENNVAVLLVDASNAFTSLNREVFLHNISYICPTISAFIKNCYNSPSRLVIIGGKKLKSNDGTTQGDPVSMAIYGIGVTPLISMLIDIAATSTESQVGVLAYADDFLAAEKLDDLRKWRDTLTIIGPKFGYYPESTKTWLVVKPYVSQRTNKIFSGTKIKIASEGHRYLAGIFSAEEFKYTYMGEKVMEWINQLEVLSKIAVVEPQTAHCVFVGGFKYKVTYTMRTVPDIRKHLEKLDQTVDAKFIPTLTDGHFCNEMERKLLSRPVKYSGMGIVTFCDIAENEYNNSRALTASLIKFQLEQNTAYSVNREEIKMLKTNIKLEKLWQNTQKLNVIQCSLSGEKLKLNDRHQEKGTSIWLSTLPLKDEGYCLNKQEFWDLVKLRYG